VVRRERRVTPEFIRAGAKKALDDGRTFYTFARGITELREAIATWVTANPAAPSSQRVTVPGAAMMGVQIALHACASRVTTSRSSRRCGRTFFRPSEGSAQSRALCA